jgi:hypothetical protein
MQQPGNRPLKWPVGARAMTETVRAGNEVAYRGASAGRLVFQMSLNTFH